MLELMSKETMKLLGSTKLVIDKIKSVKMCQNQNLLKLFQYTVIQQITIINKHLKYCLVLYQINSLVVVTRNNIVWKLARGYCLCYCKTFLLVLDSTECTKIFVTEKCRTLFMSPKSNNIIGQRKTTNKGKHFYP